MVRTRVLNSGFFGTRPMIVILRLFLDMEVTGSQEARE